MAQFIWPQDAALSQWSLWPPISSGGGGGGGDLQWTKYDLDYTDFSIGALQNDVLLFALGAKEFIHEIVISHDTSFTGGAISAYTVSIGVAGNLDKLASDFDVFQASGADVAQISTCNEFLSKTSSTNIRIRATSVGANLSAATQGAVSIWVLKSTLT